MGHLTENRLKDVGKGQVGSTFVAASLGFVLGSSSAAQSYYFRWNLDE
jgi:hypothetical protein